MLRISGAVTDLVIIMTTSTSFEARWSEPSSHPVCGTVQYIVTVYTGGIVISNNTVERTTYTATRLCSNSSYEINVIAVNDAGSSDPVTEQVMTNETGMYVRCFVITETAVCLFPLTHICTHVKSLLL